MSFMFYNVQRTIKSSRLEKLPINLNSGKRELGAIEAMIYLFPINGQMWYNKATFMHPLEVGWVLLKPIG